MRSAEPSYAQFQRLAGVAAIFVLFVGLLRVNRATHVRSSEGARFPFDREDGRIPSRASEVQLMRVLIASGLVALILSLGSVVLFAQDKVFHSPDETSNRIFTEEFGRTGKLWYENELLPLDRENLLHPRGVLTHNDRAVPFNYLGVPLVYGGLYSILGENVRYVGLFWAAAAIVFLYWTAKELFAAKWLETLAVLSGCTPLIYYFNLPYMNALPAIAMFCGGMSFLARYYKRPAPLVLLIASTFFAISMLFRYEYILFASPLVAIVLVQTHRSPATRGFGTGIALYATTVCAIFIVPVLVLNQWVYGSWTTYGYSLFNDVYFPDRNAQEGVSGVHNVIRTARGVLLPAYPLSPLLVVENVIRFMLLLTPGLFVAALAGIGLIVRRGLISWRVLALYGVLALYVMTYRGSSGNLFQGTDGLTPTFNASVVRYWLPLYVAATILACYAIHQIAQPAIRGLSMAAIVLIGAATLGYVTDGNVGELRGEVRSQEAWSSDVLVTGSAENAIVYAGRSDKSIVPYRYAAAWWNGGELYDARTVAASIARVYPTGRPVFVVREREVDLVALNEALKAYNLRAKGAGRGQLARVVPTELTVSYSPQR